MKSFLKFLSRNKLYTAVEAVGLAVSLAFVILIGSYVVQHYKVAHESPEWKRTFVLGSDEFLGLTYWDKEELQMNIPEVEAATHLAFLWQPAIYNGEEAIHASGMEADADFFKVFPEYRLVEGSLEDFVGKDDILISESLSRKIGKQVGQTLKIDDADRTIKGIFADFDETFFMPMDIITNISATWAAEQSKAFNSIGNYATWFLVRKDADLDAMRSKVKALLHKNYDPTWQAEKVDKWKAYRMDEAFFFPGASDGLIRSGNAQMLRLLTVVVLLLLLSAIFNYVNLSLALTGKRAKEMATRRLLGADKSGVLWKYISESVVFTAICFAAAMLLADLFEPMVNSLVSTRDPDDMLMGIDTSVRLSFMLTPGYILAYLAGILVLGVINGLLPAFAASRYQPIDVIRGTLRRRNKMVLSKVFIVVQNVLSVFLIALALVMEVQMRHMLARPMHAATDNLYYIEYSAQNYDQMKLFKDKVERLPFVTKAGVGRGIPGMINMNGAQPEFIGGVVTDFPTRPASEGEINPNGGVIVTRVEELQYSNCLLIGTTGEDKSYEDQILQAYKEFRLETLGVEQSAWRYGFIKDINRKQLSPVRRTLRLVELFAVLAVLISLLGLLAMSTYFAGENTKQIAVRKVFGSDVSNETWRTVRSYMVLVGVACLVGIPLAIWASRLYLQRFAYRIEGYGWVFIVAVIISLAIAFATVLWQTLQAARTNPATELKKE